MSNRCRGCNLWMRDDIADNVCGFCEKNRCPNDPDEEYVHPRDTTANDCVRCLRALVITLTGGPTAKPEGVQRIGGNVQILRQVDKPDAGGWWACSKSGRVKWFRIEDCDEGFFIFDGDMEKMVPLEDYCRPLASWYGPVAVPKDP